MSNFIIQSLKILLGRFIYINLTRRLEIKKKRAQDLQKWRDIWREEGRRHSIENEQEQVEENSDEEAQKTETAPFQGTDTRTKSDHVDAKPAPENNNQVGVGKLETSLNNNERKPIPPGPGQYDLPTDV